MSFFTRLEKLIKDNNTNFTELERNLGLGKGTISNWRDRNPTYDKLIKVVNYLNADILWLMSDDLNTSNTTYIMEDATSYTTNNEDALHKLDIDTQKAINFLIDKLSNTIITNEYRRILSLFNLLGRDEKNQIIGMLELKVSELNKKILYSDQKIH